MNIYTFTGGLGRDCEQRFTPKGDAVTSFSVAVNSGYGDKAVTSWINCNLWGKQAESLAPYLLKGTKVAVSGEFTLRPYTTKDGLEKTSADVRVNSLTLLGSKDGAMARDSAPKTQDGMAGMSEAQFDESIPF
jgi:single-strand DNA-binding protein